MAMSWRICEMSQQWRERHNRLKVTSVKTLCFACVFKNA
jgi:hypothetical protein